MMVQGGGNPSASMALEPRCRMGPPLRSFAADAHGCIMVRVLNDPPNTSLRCDVCAAYCELPFDRDIFITVQSHTIGLSTE